MEAWANQFPSIQFVCVCVESARVAQMFHSMIGFEKSKNAFIPSRQYLPRGYGQLGCSGFIIADQKANFISRKTMRFLDYGEQAFRQVEQILMQELEALEFQSAKKGEAVKGIVMDGRSKRKLPQEEKEEEKKDMSLEERLSSFLNDHGTGIDMVDHEHGECITVLQRLVKNPNEENLETAIQLLVAHFQSEEDMMQAYQFGGDRNSSFSALRSHALDHQRILQLGQVELKRLQASGGV